MHTRIDYRYLLEEATCADGAPLKNHRVTKTQARGIRSPPFERLVRIVQASQHSIDEALDSLSGVDSGFPMVETISHLGHRTLMIRAGSGLKVSLLWFQNPLCKVLRRDAVKQL